MFSLAIAKRYALVLLLLIFSSQVLSAQGLTQSPAPQQPSVQLQTPSLPSSDSIDWSSVGIQRWVQMRREPNANFYDIQREFNNTWAKLPRQKGDGFKAFKRWEHFWESRIMPDGSFPPGLLYWNAIQEKMNAKNALLRANSKGKGNRLQSNPVANFRPLGPTLMPTNNVGTAGSGRVNFVAFHPTNTNIIWVGTPAGGLWRSTNDGVTWTSNTDQFTTLGVSAIAFDPANPNTAYIGTGDRDASDTYGVGVLKTTDGGATWNTTGFTNTMTGFVNVAKILVHPTNTNIVLVAASNGIWRSTNGGTNFTQTQSNSGYMDMEFRPNDPTTVYATRGGTFVRSTDNGVTWATVSMGFTTSNVNRIALAVAPSNQNLLYALCSNATGSTYFGLYRSTDNGATWSVRSTTPNILGGNQAGNDTRGQGWYDLCLAVNPTNENDIFGGGINMWRSTNGGTNWNCITMWFTGTSLPYVHADHHHLTFKPGSNELYSGHDGGVDKTTNLGTTWINRNDGLQIMQFYRISHALTNNTTALGGAQDNGTNRMVGTAWTQIYGGDGMDNAIDPTNANNMYASSQFGNFGRSTNGGNSFTSISPTGQGGTGAWVTPIVHHPTTSGTIYIAYRSVCRSTNRGTNWDTIGLNILSSNATYLAVTPANPNHFVVGNGSQIFRTTNGGTNWTNIKGTLPNSINRVTIHPTRPDTIYAVIDGWTSGSKVFRSFNGGSTWTNITGTLPNIPINCLAIENNSVEGMYLGTDVGIYYRNNTMSDWIPYDDGLPNVIVNDIEIHTPTNTIRAGTYGRGLWEGDAYSQTPRAQFTSAVSACAGGQISFTNTSTNNPTSFEWVFNGGTPNTSTAQNPTITYTNPGTYSVTLRVFNAFGSDTLTRNSYITINPLPVGSIFSSANTACFGDSITLTAPSASRYQWTTSPADTLRTLVLRQAGNYSVGVTITNANGCVGIIQPVNAIIHPRPDVSISTNGATEFCSGDSLTLSAPGGLASYQWSNGQQTQSIIVRTSNTYTVTGTSVNGCTATASIGVVAKPRPSAVLTVVGQTSFCQGDSVIISVPAVPSYTYRWSNGATTRSITVKESGSYFVTVSDTNGCSRVSDTTSVLVRPLPTSSITHTTPLTFCEGESVVLDAGINANEYLWSSGETTRTITATKSGTYSVKITSSFGCVYTTPQVTVSVNPNPRTPLIVERGSLSLCSGDSVILDAGANFASYAWSNGSTSRRITVRQAGKFYVRRTTASDNGCVSQSDTVQVTMLASSGPRLRLISGAMQLCEGDSAVIDAGDGYSEYLWANGKSSRLIAVRTSGTFYVRVKAGSCEGKSDTIQIVVNPRPEKPTITRNGDELMSSTQANRYQWFRDGVVLSAGTSRSIVATATGEYSVRVWSAEGCSSTSEIFSTVVSVDETERPLNISVQPNPTNDVCSIRFTLDGSNTSGVQNGSQPIKITVLSIDGKEVMTSTVVPHSGENTAILHLNTLANGTYILRIDGLIQGRSVIRKVVKNS